MNIKFAQKKILRKKYLQERLGLSENVVSSKSLKIFENFKRIRDITSKNNFLLYLPINNEVETKFLINYLTRKKHNIFLPRYLSTEQKWIICKFEGWNNLEKGPLGIVQPKNKNSNKAKEVDLAVVPGIAFSKDLVRLGFGKGVYDYLLGDSRALKIGLAYDFQIVEEIPCEKHDIRIDMVVTEKRVIGVNYSI